METSTAQLPSCTLTTFRGVDNVEIHTNDNRKMTETDGSSEPVILATAGYDHAIKFWQAHSGICHRTVQHPDSVSFVNMTLEQLQNTRLEDSY